MRRSFLQCTLAFLSAVLLGTHAPAQPTEEVLSVRVVPVNDPRLSALTPEQANQVLDVASTMIDRSYGRQVKFDLQPAETLPKWFDDRWATIAPYEIPADYRADLFDDDLKRFEQDAFNACKLYGTVEQLKGLLDEDRRGGVTNHASAARALLEQYKQRRARIRDMLLPDGTKLITQQTRRMFSHGHWGLWLAVAPEITTPELYLTNILLIDDFLADPAPHSLASSLAYGFMYPTTNRVVVTCLPMLSEDRLLLPPAVRNVPNDRKRLLIAYTIAHEIGTHLVMELNDSYDADAGLARPMIAFRDPQMLGDYENWPRTRVDLRTLKPESFHVGVATQRLEVAVARKDRAAAEKALEAASWLRLTREQSQYIEQLYLDAKWD